MGASAKGCLRYGEKHAKYNLISCACMLLFTNMQFSCKQSGEEVSTWANLMVVSYAKVPPFIIYYEVCCCLHIKYIVYKHVNT